MRVPAEDVLGEVDEGFRYAQVRLGPARMTHVCGGSARLSAPTRSRSPTSSEREAFGVPLAELGMVEQMIADNEIDLAATRALLPHGLPGARRRAPRGRERDLDREDVRRGGDPPGRRPLDADVRRAGVSRRPAGGAHRPGDPAVPDLRRPVRGAPDVTGAQGCSPVRRDDGIHLTTCGAGGRGRVRRVRWFREGCTASALPAGPRRPGRRSTRGSGRRARCGGRTPR